MSCKPALLSILLVLGLCAGASADLIAYFPFAEGTGITTADATGNGNDGAFDGNVEWVPGVEGTAVRLDTPNERIQIGGIDPTAAKNAMTLAAWVKWEGEGNSLVRQGIMGKRQGWNPLTYVKWFWEAQNDGDMVFRNGNIGIGYDSKVLIPYANQWAHVALTWTNGVVTQYINGEQVLTGKITFRDTADATVVTIACNAVNNNETFIGSMDEVRIYDTALTPGEIAQVMAGNTTSASGPQPADGATDVSRDVILSWMPGESAAGHDVYLGTSFNDVNEASRADGRGVLRSQGQADVTYDPGRLQIGTTCYWRVDEVNAPPNPAIFKGLVWSFTVEPFLYPIAGGIKATASSSSSPAEGPENTINGSGLNADGLHSVDGAAMWLSGAGGPGPAWIEYEFNKPYKLYQMQVWNYNTSIEPAIGVGVRNATVEYSANGTDWTALTNVPEFAQAPGADGYAAGTTVDFDGVTATHVKLTVSSNWKGLMNQYGLSEVRFFYLPVSAREPSPQLGAIDVAVDATLSWRAGREAAMHKVYVSTDQQAVISGTAPVATVTSPSYAASLDLASTCYWRIDEVNDAETPSTWPGEVWSFSTVAYIVVDNFESYNNVDPPDPKSHRIFESWTDGYGTTTNGALVGYDSPQPAYAERTIVHGGKQAMPVFYNNFGGATFSEATYTFAAPQDWTQHSIKTLSLYFYGATGNVGQLYVKINGTKVPYSGAAGDLAVADWHPWAIDLGTSGANLKNVTTLAIGIDGNGAAGTLYFDDIRLYATPAALLVPAN